MVALPSRDPNQADARHLLERSFSQRSVIHMRSGTTIPLIRKSLWIVVRGLVKLGSVTEHGDDILLGLAGPNEVFGESLTSVQAYEAVALDDCDLLCVTLDELDQSPELYLSLFHAISSRNRQAESLLALLAYRRIEDRLKAFLELIALDYGQVCSGGLKINVRLTHHEIASALSTTRVTVTRVIGHLRKSGWLSFDRDRSLIVCSVGEQQLAT